MRRLMAVLTVAMLLAAPGAATGGTESPRLAQPATIVARGGVLKATLVAAERHVMVAGRRTLAKTYGPRFIGPTLVLRPGDRVELTLVNRLSETTNLHFHGLHVPATGSADNVFVSVAPGQSHRYSFTLPKSAPAGTYWYHSHAMAMSPDGMMAMTSEEQVFDGLSGVLEVRGHTPVDGLPQRVIALKDVQVHDGAIVSGDIDSQAATTRTVDGQLHPRMTIAPGERQLWRIANIGADIFYAVHLDGHSFTVVGQDGQPVVHPWHARTLIMPPGKRFDVTVTGAAHGQTQLRTLAFDQHEDLYPQATLATLQTVGVRHRPAFRIPTTIARPANLSARPVARRREVVFGENPDDNTFSINGRSYDPGRVDFRAKLDTVEEWTIANHTEELHPFHMHTYAMQVMAVNGVPQPFDGDQDEVVLPPHGYVTIRIAFDQFTGETVFHCHILAHEDAGMMANIVVGR